VVLSVVLLHFLYPGEMLGTDNASGAKVLASISFGFKRFPTAILYQLKQACAKLKSMEILKVCGLNHSVSSDSSIWGAHVGNRWQGVTQMLSSLGYTQGRATDDRLTTTLNVILKRSPCCKTLSTEFAFRQSINKKIRSMNLSGTKQGQTMNDGAMPAKMMNINGTERTYCTLIRWVAGGLVGESPNRMHRLYGCTGLQCGKLLLDVSQMMPMQCQHKVMCGKLRSALSDRPNQASHGSMQKRDGGWNGMVLKNLPMCPMCNIGMVMQDQSEHFGHVHNGKADARLRNTCGKNAIAQNWVNAGLP